MRHTALRAVTGTIVVLLVLAGLVHYFQYSSYSFLTNAQARISETVVINGAVYTVDDGVVMRDGELIVERSEVLQALRRAYEKTQAKRSPLFALPGTDLAAFDTAIDELEVTARLLADGQVTAAHATAVRDSLYPVRFLRALHDAEAARRAFVASGSDTDVAHYRTALSLVADAYRADVRTFTRAFEHTVSIDIPAYVTSRISVERSAMRSVLAKLHERINDVDRMRWERTVCRWGITYACDADSIALPFVADVAQTSADTAHEQRIRAHYTIMETPTLVGPVYELHESACVRGAPRFSIAAVNGSVYREIVPLGDMRLVRTNEQSAIPFFRTFAEAGLTYAPAKEMNHYSCIDIGRDAGTLAALQHIRAYATAHSLGTRIESDTLLTLEQTLAGNVVRESDARAYLRYALGHERELSPATRDALTELALQLLYQSADSEWLLERVTYVERMTHDVGSRTGEARIPAPYLFFTRSGIVPLSMAHNASFGAYTSPFPTHDGFSSESPYVYLSVLEDDADVTLQRDLHRFGEIVGSYYGL